MYYFIMNVDQKLIYPLLNLHAKIIAGIPPTPVYLYTRPVAYFQHIKMHIYNLFHFLVFFPASPLSPV